MMSMGCVGIMRVTLCVCAANDRRGRGEDDDKDDRNDVRTHRARAATKASSGHHTARVGVRMSVSECDAANERSATRARRARRRRRWEASRARW